MPCWMLHVRALPPSQNGMALQLFRASLRDSACVQERVHAACERGCSCACAGVRGSACKHVYACVLECVGAKPPTPKRPSLALMNGAIDCPRVSSFVPPAPLPRHPRQ